MKGKTTIELTDVNTGKKKTYTEENMFTNALTEIYQNNFMSFGVASSKEFFSTLIRDLTSKESMIGGVYCLDTKLDEDASIIEVPSGVGITAHAGAEYNGLSKTRGSFNSSESEYLGNGYKFVWDFATNQGNGTIACVGLTTSYGGNCGEDFGYSDSSIISPCIYNQTTGTYIYAASTGNGIACEYTIAGIDDNMYIYQMAASSTTSITIRKSSKPYPIFAPLLVNNYDISYDTSSAFYLDEEVTITLPVAMNSTTAGTGWRFVIDGENMYLIARANSSATSLYVYELDFGNATVTSYYTVATTQAFNSSVASVYISNGYLYVFTTDLDVNKINYTTGNTVKTSPTFTDGTTEHIQCVDYYGRIVLNGNSTISSNSYYYYYWDEDTNKWKRMGNLNGSGNSAFIKWISPYYLLRKYGHSSNTNPTYHWIDTMFEASKPLITINNLSSSVTKTSAQTMKITYTVTES